ncbi:MAG: T9SS type A sorting domain-containing protein [Bacteroidia bacterium]|nr:T9SS type A sorting domain-containing protein [Bacteroidia bacterium]
MNEMTQKGRTDSKLRTGLLMLLALQSMLLTPCIAQLRIDTLLNAQRVSSLVRLKSGDLFLKTNDAVLHSRDDGQSWEPLPLPDQMRDVGKIAMVWRDNASGLLHAASSTIAGGYVFAWTEDCGAHWTVDEFIPSERFGFSKTYGAFSPIQLTGDSSFFTIVDARLYGTKDRGRTYYHIEKPGYVNNLHFDGQFGWMQIVRHIRENDTELHVTTDGGATWSQPELPVIVRKFELHPSGRGILQGGPVARDVYATAPHEITLEPTGVPSGWELAYSEHSEYIYIDSLHRGFYSTIGLPSYPGRSHSKGYIYFSSDGGERWFRTQAPDALHTAIGIAPGVVLFRTREDRLLRVTLTDERSFILTAKNTSSFDAPRITLTWSDPSCGSYKSAAVERSYAGSEWVHVGSVLPPDQYFIDEMLTPGYSVRYRVTLITPEGSIRQISDTLTALPDVYVNFLSYILQPRDEPIKFRYPVAAGGGGPAANILTCTYRGYVDSSRWERVHTFEVTVISPKGDTLQARDCLHEYRGPEPSFAQPCGFPSFGILGFERLTPLEIENDSTMLYQSSGPFLCHYPSSVFADTDSMQFTIGLRMWAYPLITFTAARGKGIIRKHYSWYEIDEMGQEHSADVRWERMDAVNTIGARDVANASTPVFVYPNPVSASATIEYNVRSHGSVRISVHDMLGREVVVVLDARRSPGVYFAVFDASILPAGMYICRVVTGGGSSSALLQRFR